MFGGTIDAYTTIMQKLMGISSLVEAKYNGSNMFELAGKNSPRELDYFFGNG